MQFGFVLPGGDARVVAESAEAAERAGWDAIFVWEPVWGVDAWVSLTAAAMTTERIRLGTMLTPISRMRPWKLASETATLDNLSGGRVTLAVGLGAVDSGFVEFGEETDLRTRAELVDEGLEILTGLWRGLPFEFDGTHYRVQAPTLPTPPPPPPVQQPIPIWVVGAWKRMKSVRRALKYGGIIPQVLGPDGTHEEVTPQVIREIRSFVRDERPDGDSFDIVVEGSTDPTLPADVDRAAEWADAGATWWTESMWMDGNDASAVRRRIDAGPPR